VPRPNAECFAAALRTGKGGVSVLSGPPANKINGLGGSLATVATVIGDRSLTLGCKSRTMRAALCWLDVLRLQVERRRLDNAPAIPSSRIRRQRAAVLRDTEAQGAVEGEAQDRALTSHSAQWVAGWPKHGIGQLF
jgi:hypothetical protein